MFSLERYAEVIEAYLAGLEAYRRRPRPACRSVASFFVSRVDTEVDRRLEAIGTDEALALRGKAAVAQAQLAYQLLPRDASAGRAGRRSPPGAPGCSGRCGRRRRPRTRPTPTRSTSTRLIGPDTVNTMPEATLEAVRGPRHARPHRRRRRRRRPGQVIDASWRGRRRHGRRRPDARGRGRRRPSPSRSTS